jgi:hypothetical protein
MSRHYEMVAPLKQTDIKQMPITNAEACANKRKKEKESGFVKLYDPITPEQREGFKLVIAGNAKIVLIKGK